MIAPAPPTEPAETASKKLGPVQRLLRLTETARLFRSDDGRSYARVLVGSRIETHALLSTAFRAWLIDGYYRACREVPADWSIRRVLAALEATARFEAGAPSVFVRVGREQTDHDAGSAFYLDLADACGQAVRIAPEGWSVVDNAGAVHFHRPDGHLPMPVPSRDASIDLLRSYVPLDDRDFRLLIVWMAAALRPVGPYPILALYGQSGSAKSTLARIVRRLTDPQAGPLLNPPRNARDLMVSAVNGWVLAYDNMSVIPQWMSDALCMLATGGAMTGVTSFTRAERSIIHVQRPALLNGIDEFVTRGDLADRAVFLSLPPIVPSDRLCEIEYWARFQADYPRILGALLDAVVGGLRELPSVRPRQLPRMADFAKFAEAVGRSLGWPAGTALADYDSNRRDASMVELEDSPLGAFLLDLSPDFFMNWSGNPSVLLEELNSLAGEQAQSDRWPKSPQRLTVELRRLAPMLATQGLYFHWTRTNRGRIVSVCRDRKAIDQGQSCIAS